MKKLDIKQIKQEFYKIINNYYILKEETKDKDISSLISKLINLSHSILLSIIWLDQLTYKSTRLQISPKNINIINQSGDPEIYLQEYDSFIRTSYITLLTNCCLEASFKDILNNKRIKIIDSGKKIIKNSKSIIDENLFELLSIIRNSIHTNGLHFPDNEKKKRHQITYNGKQYTFNEGTNISICTRELLIEINHDIYKLIQNQL